MLCCLRRAHKVDCVAQFKNEVQGIIAGIDFLGDVRRVTSKLMSDLHNTYNRCFPLRVKYVSQKCMQNQLITSGILNSIKTRSQYLKLCKLGLIGPQLYHKYRNRLNSVIQQAKKNYFINTFNSCQSNIKKTWSVIKQLLAKESKSSTIKSILVNNVEITETSEIASHFNDFFADIAHTLNSQLPPSDRSPYHTVVNNNVSSAFFRLASISEVNSIIQNLKNTSKNVNEVPVWLFKNIRTILAEPITKLINSSISSGVFPECLKCARIVPIFKKGKPTNMSNYRPIAILPTISKIFKKNHNK